jgi:hypothetical protein
MHCYTEAGQIKVSLAKEGLPNETTPTMHMHDPSWIDRYSNQDLHTLQSTHARHVHAYVDRYINPNLHTYVCELTLN